MPRATHLQALQLPCSEYLWWFWASAGAAMEANLTFPISHLRTRSRSLDDHSYDKDGFPGQGPGTGEVDVCQSVSQSVTSASLTHRARLYVKYKVM